MTRITKFVERACLIALTVGLCRSLCAQQGSRIGEERRKPVLLTIEMLQMASVSESTVCLGDVAKIRGGSETARKTLAALDVAECDLSGKSAAVTRQQVSFRLRL